jgi:hypothetical protein
VSNYPDGFDHDLLDEEPEPEETESHEPDFDEDDLVDPDGGYDPQERMQWDGGEEP